MVCVEEWVDPLTLVAYEGTAAAAAAAKQKEVRKDDGDGNDAIRIGGVNNNRYVPVLDRISATFGQTIVLKKSQKDQK